jgi:SAM-dependent methyltransferase
MKDSETLEQVSRQGRERLYPALTNPSWLLLRKRREIFQRWLQKLPARKFCILDIGGRVQPYRPLLADCLEQYISIDLRRTPLVNILARGEQLPFKENMFDLVICTQVLQYVADPKLVMLEVHRVLKQNGYLILSVPAACPRDADEECWRFLPAGLGHLLFPFHYVEIVPEGASVAGFFRIVNACLNIFVRYPSARLLFQRTACPVLNLLGVFLDQFSGNDQFAVNYSVLAQK